MRHQKFTGGFTLIELSIVLIIVGLIVGGILVGRDLIEAANIRSKISQRESYNVAVNTFRVKYGNLPGDIPDPDASSFGFTSRTKAAGLGDGNGIMEGFWATNCGTCEGWGENTTAWNDLATAQLIPGHFVGKDAPPSPDTPTFLIPAARGDNFNYFYIYSNNSINYFGLSKAAHLTIGISGGGPGLKVQQAYLIDAKTDDGMPQTGTVTAVYLNPNVIFPGGDTGVSDTSTATPPSATSCYDDGGVNGSTRHYSTSVNGGEGMNCGLSFRFQ